jgi:hypothetical protein
LIPAECCGVQMQVHWTDVHGDFYKFI